MLMTSAITWRQYEYTLLCGAYILRRFATWCFSASFTAMRQRSSSPNSLLGPACLYAPLRAYTSRSSAPFCDQHVARSGCTKTLLVQQSRTANTQILHCEHEAMPQQATEMRPPSSTSGKILWKKHLSTPKPKKSRLPFVSVISVASPFLALKANTLLQPKEAIMLQFRGLSLSKASWCQRFIIVPSRYIFTLSSSVQCSITKKRWIAFTMSTYTGQKPWP